MKLGVDLGKIVTSAAKLLVLSTISMGALMACENNANIDVSTGGGEPMIEPLAPAAWADAAAGFIAPDGSNNGYVVLTNAPGAGVLMRVDLNGLSQGWHGIHLHNIGDCSDGGDGFKASGGHVDPENHEHGLLNTNGPERADIPNIYAGADGRATAEIFNAAVALYASEEAAAAAGPHPLMDADGFAIVVHANADDHETQPIGGAGPRVACAAIGGTGPS